MVTCVRTDMEIYDDIMCVHLLQMLATYAIKYVETT